MRLRQPRRRVAWRLAAVATLLVGLGAGYAAWRGSTAEAGFVQLDAAALEPHYPTRYQPAAHRDYYPAFEPALFPTDGPRRFFAFDFAAPVTDRWRLVAVGDVMAHAAVQISAFAHREAPGETAMGYDWLLAAAKPVIAGADLAIGNLETVVSADVPRQGNPRFNADPALLQALANLGFDALSIANNHILDYGERGMRDTEAALTAHGLAFTGTGAAPGAGVLLKVAGGGGATPLTIGLIAVTDWLNGSAVGHALNSSETAQVNYLCDARHRLFRMVIDRAASGACYTSEIAFLDATASAIARLRSAGADYVIVFLHRGRAWSFFPSRREYGQAESLALAGADAVISSGAHVMMPIERIYSRDGAIVDDPSAREHLLVHGLGNFVSAQRLAAAYGLIAQIDIGRDAQGGFRHAVTPLFAKSSLTLERVPVGARLHELEVYRLRVLDFDAFLTDIADLIAR